MKKVLSILLVMLMLTSPCISGYAAADDDLTTELILDRLIKGDEAAETASDQFYAAFPNGKLDFDAIVPSLLQSCLPDIMIGLVVVLVLSASMSTLSSLVFTSSSTVTIDLIRPLTKGKMNEKKEVLTMRVFIAAFLLISVVIALNKNAYISTLMSISWGALAGAFLAPFMYGI